jgi:hypothetical protein
LCVQFVRLEQMAAGEPSSHTVADVTQVANRSEEFGDDDDR